MTRREDELRAAEEIARTTGKSRTTGMVPSWILGQIRGDNMNDVPACYIDTSLKNVFAGVWRYQEDGTVMLQP